MQAVKTAVIGCGARAHVHASAALSSDALKLIYACDVDGGRAESAAAEWGATACTDYRRALEDTEVEAALIATDVTTHIPIARDALKAGKHVLLEKPLGDDIASARQLVAAGTGSDRVLYVSFQLRFVPQLVSMQAIAVDIDPVQIFFSRQRAMLKPQFLTPSPFHGILDVCAHDFDMVSWFMRRSPVAVTSILGRNRFTRDTGAVDSISALIDYGDGRSATVVSSIGAAEIGTKCDIVGSRGNISQDASGKATGVRFAEFQSEGDKQPLSLPTPSEADFDVPLHTAFAHEIRDGVGSQAATLDDALNSLLLALACVRSAEEGRRVKLEEMG